MFIVRENWDGVYQIVNDEFLFATNDRTVFGSYGVIQAKILGFTYPDFLRYCRANFNGLLRGREGYSYCVFKNKDDCRKLCNILNNEWIKVKKYFKEDVSSNNEAI